MKPFTLVYYSATSMEISSLSAGFDRFTEAGGRAEVHARTQTQLFDTSRIKAFAELVRTADVVIISLHGGRDSCPGFDDIVNCSGEKTWVHVQPSGGDEDGAELAERWSTGFGTVSWDMVYKYIHYGGPLNFRNLLFFLGHIAEHGSEPDNSGCEPPVPLPHEGIYHPDFDCLPDPETYFREKIVPGRPVAGLWFNQSYWVNNNLEFIDALIRTAEQAGACVIPVFHLRYRDRELANNGADYIARNYFMRNGKPLIDVLINPMMFSLCLADPDYRDIYPGLDVPVIQAMITMQPTQAWEKSIQGMTTTEVSYAAAQPEFDGALICVPVAARDEAGTDPLTGALVTKYLPIQNRVDRLVSLALNWARLSAKENSDKKIAIVFHHYPPRNDRIGCAAGLDSFASVRYFVDDLKAAGYTIDSTYESAEELSEKVLSAMTCDRRWLLPEQMYERACARAVKHDYQAWHKTLPEKIRKKQVEDWGPVPGDLFVHNGEMMFPGIHNGNIFITIQPPRGYFENIEKIYHDMYLSVPHHYIAHYRYIKDIFKADAVIHVGKHGSLEWLPGKALGLSDTCWPDPAIMDLPNIYPYIINDPGEGTQAKRRSHACIIDHLTPVFKNADLYEDLAGLDNLLRDYTDAAREDSAKIQVLRPMIWEAVEKADLDRDLGITREKAMDDFQAFLEKLHSYLGELSDTMINDGLHVLGKPPRGERLSGFLVQLARVDNGTIPSLRGSVIRAMGYDYDELVACRGRIVNPETGETGRHVIAKAHNIALEMAERLMHFSEEKNNMISEPGIVSEIISEFFTGPCPDIEKVLTWMAATLIPDVEKTVQESDSILAALEGRFVRPGPSGAPSRGQAGILPTGRNFYSVDPARIPSPGAWQVGKKLGNALLDRYRQETGRYPETVGIIVYGSSTMRSKGDDIAQIFYLLGVRPVWHRTTQAVTGLEIIPAKELGRPRIDVMPRISGFFRDSFPMLVDRIDEAVRMVALLEEPFETNMIRRHVLKDCEDYESKGLDHEQAFREASFRVFGCPPGTYGAGVAELVESGNWETSDDLGNNYIRYSAHAYGKGSYGKSRPEVFKTILSRMDVTVKNEDSREYDIMSCTDYYNYYGGLIAAGKAVTGTRPLSMVGDSSDPERITIRTTQEEAKHVLRARLVNPGWIRGMMRHGYKGAGDISHMMDVVLGWDATAGVIEDFMYEKIANAYVFDEQVRKWMQKVNPYARQNIVSKLLEAVSRGMWNADEKMQQALRDEYLDIEGDIEELVQ
jgi:cobaltochelatase CobN